MSSIRSQMKVYLGDAASAAFEWESGVAAIVLKQVHGAGGRWVSSASDTLGEGDWIATSTRNLRVGMRVADCTAALVLGENRDGSFVAAIHAGWRGTAANIFEKFVREVRPESGWKVWLSPKICQDHFEVGPDVISALGPDSKKFSKPGAGDRLFLDLTGFQMAQLKNLGANVISHPICSYHQPELFSYRRTKGQEKRRHLAWIELL